MSKYAYCEDYSPMYCILEGLTQKTGIDFRSCSNDFQSLFLIFVSIKLAYNAICSVPLILESIGYVQKK